VILSFRHDVNGYSHLAGDWVLGFDDAGTSAALTYDNGYNNSAQIAYTDAGSTPHDILHR
jgi:hypothetical protein